MNIKNQSAEFVKYSLLNRNGTTDIRKLLTEKFGYPIHNCQDFIKVVMLKFGYADVETTKEAILHNSVLMQLMFSIA